MTVNDEKLVFEKHDMHFCPLRFAMDVYSSN